LWHVDPFLATTTKEEAAKQSLLSNGFANKHVGKATVRNSNRGKALLFPIVAA
jgi:hypothetical protein